MINSTHSETIFVGDSEMAVLMRSYDWSQTPLGPVSEWPSSLKTAISICFNSRFPMVIWWGKDLVLLYNDAWKPILGSKHPDALGSPGHQVWSEIWDIIGVQLHSVLETGQASWSEDTLLLVDRHGYVEEAYFTYSYSPIFLETGEIGGAFTAITETTCRVVGERRLGTLRELATNTVEAKSVEEACQIASATLTNNPYDIAFALMYLIEPDGSHARLVQTVGVAAGTPTSAEHIDLMQSQNCWRLTQVKTTGNAEIINTLSSQFDTLPGGAWDEPSRSAIVLPITQAGQQEQLVGFLVLGISPRRAFDDDYRGFFDLVASNIATAIANAHAFEAERRRAETLAELDRAKTTFFDNVSHEFRTPLTLMRGPLEALTHALDTRLQPDEREQLQLVQRSSLQLQKLVNTLLDFSQIEAGRMQACYESTDLATYTAELASNFRSLIEQAGMTLTIDCPPLPEPVYVDREMWEKIVLNLLSNAFKFTFSGGITVRQNVVDNFVELSITDTGVGISEDELTCIFERFHRANGTRSRTYEGSGIGLSLVQELVKLHGGTIRVISEVDRGTTFTVALPFGLAHLPGDRIAVSSARTATTQSGASFVVEASHWLTEEARRTSMSDLELSYGDDPEINLQHAVHEANRRFRPRVFLADDNADLRAYIRRLLSQYWQVETVADGLAALEAIIQNPPDLVLCDVMMPGLNGFGLLRQLRANPCTREVPIILLSARAGEDARLEGLEAGADDYLTKPFSARELLTRVEANLKLAQLRRNATQQEQVLRQEAETAKQEAEAAYQHVNQILECMTDAFVAFDRQWHYTYANPAALKLLQKSLDELIGKNVWEEVFPNEVGGLAYRELHRAVEEQVSVTWEEFSETLQRWLEIRAHPSTQGIALYFQDITERKRIEEERRQAEEALYQSEAIARAHVEELETLMDLVPVGIWIAHDPDCHQVTANRAAYDLMRAKFGDPTTATPTDAVYPFKFKLQRNGCDVALNDLSLQRAGRTGQEALEDAELVFEDGMVRHIYGRAIPLRDEAGHVRGAVGAYVDITERKQAEAQIKQLNQQLTHRVNELQTLFDLLPIGVAIATDPECRTIRANPYLSNLIRVPVDANASQSALPDERPAYRLCRDGVEIPVENLPMQYAAHHNVEVRDEVVDIVHPDGTLIKMLSYCSPLLDEQNQVRGSLGGFIDITQRLQNEAALRESQERLKIALQTGKLGSWQLDLTTCVLESSEQCKANFGLTPDEDLSVQRLFELIHPDDRAYVQDTVERAIAERIDYDAEYRAIWPDGSTHWIIARGRAMYLEDGSPVRMIGVTLDLTERKQMELALRQSETILNAFIASSPVGIAFFDRNWRYIYVNEALAETNGVPLSDHLGQAFRDVLPQWAPFVEPIFEQVIQTKVPLLNQEVVGSTYPTDLVRYGLVNYFPVCLPDGEAIGVGVTSLDITDRKQAEIALQQSEEQLRLASEGANLGMWHWDVTTDTLTWTSHAKALFGLPPETEMSMQVFLEAVHPDDRPLIQTVVADLQIGQCHTEIEYRTMWPDGTVRWILARGNSIFDENGTLILTRGVLIDITERKRVEEERKQAEEALRQSEERLQILANNVPSMVWMADPNGTMVWVSDAWYSYTGITPEQNARDWPQVLHPDDLERCLTQWRRSLEQGEPYEIEVRNRRTDGEYRWFLTQAVPMRNETGDITAWFGSTTDIHEKKLTEVALRENMAVLNAVNQATPILIYVKDRHGRILMANPATVRSLGKPETDIIGKTEREFLGVAEAEQIIENDRQVMETGQVNVFEEIVFTSEGQRTFLSTKSPYRDWQGAIIGLIGVSTDITDRKQTEAEREQLLIREQAAREAAETANRIKDEFLAVVSHELRSPLNPILGWAKLLRTRQFDAQKTDRALEVIERNAQMQAQLINDLLDVSRILRGKLSLETKPVNLVTTIDTAIETVRLAADAKSIQIHTQFDPKVGYVSGDPGRLQQVVWNLLSNAVKFTSEGGRVEVKLESYELSVSSSQLSDSTQNSKVKTRNYAQITVTDTGKGIPPNFLPYVFDHFRQESSATTRRFGGLGLGLAIVRYLVELHGGTVQADSAGEGQGSTFTVHLPLMLRQPATRSETLPSEPSLDLQGSRILVVDDDDNTREFLVFLLELHGATALSAANATDAIAMLAEFQPDVLLSDIGMPDIDGYMLLRQVRSLPPAQGGRVPAIALTAYAGEFDQKQALAAGFQHHLAKPAEPEQLINLITTLIQKSNGQS